MPAFRDDVRFAARAVVRRPAFSAAVILTLALGIGANTAIFTVVHAVLLRSLPFPQAERLVVLYSVEPGADRQPFSIPDFLDIRAGARSFDGIVAWGAGNANLTGPEETVPLRAQWTTPGYFELLGVRPALGRAPLPEEERPGGGRVVLLGDPLWRTRFGADPTIVGRSLTLNGEPFTVIGVLPREFVFSSLTAELAAPLILETDARREKRGAAFLRLLGRLSPGTDLPSAQAEVAAVGARLRTAYPDTNANKEGVQLLPFAEVVVGNTRRSLVILQAAVFLVLLIACTNLASLSLTRVVGRRGELAVRLALGARRRDLVRQILVESGLLALLGGLAGLLVAAAGVRGLLAIGPAQMPRAAEIGLDLPVLAFNLAVSILAGLGLGLVPALSGTRAGLTERLREDARGQVGGRRGGRARAALVSIEVGLSLVLLVGAGLLLRTIARLQDASPGFSPERVLAVQLSLPKERYKDPESIARYAEQITGRLSALPGVTVAAAASLNPLTNWRANIAYTIAGSDIVREKAPTANYRAVAPGYFRALGVRQIAGRDVTASDGAGGAAVALVSETLARRHFPGGGAVGSRIEMDDVEGWRTAEIVGVVGDIKHYGLDTEGTADLYVPYPQTPPQLSVWFANIFCLAVRTDSDPGRLAAAARKEIAAFDRDVAISSIRPLEEAFEASLADRRFSARLLELFGLSALVLALAGIYSVTAFAVVERTREIGVRISLGSGRGRILGLVVRQAMRPVAAGLLAGIAAALALSRLISSLLVGVTPHDPSTFIAAALLLSSCAALACVLPALRATRIDPVRALRAE